MKIIIVIALILGMFVSCNNNETKSIIISEKNIGVEQGNNTMDEEIIMPTHENTLHIDSISVDGKIFFVCQSDSLNLFIIDYKNDTIYKLPDWVSETEFIDFNDDGYTDMLFHYLTNVPGISDLALYDKKTSTFKIVNNFADFPSPIKIQGTKYYYSYHRSGCADSNWDSDLFTIINNNAITIGNIHGIGCGVDEKNGIYINKVQGEEKKLIKFIEKEQGYWDGKWEFIKTYWTENYKKFETVE